MTHLLSFKCIRPVLGALEGAEASSQISFESAILLVLVVVLGFMGKKLADLGRTVRALEARLGAGPQSLAEPTVAPPITPAEPAAVHGAAPSLTTDIAVVIAAAVAATYGRAARVVAVTDTTGPVRPWSLEGRRQIFASHNFR